MPTPARSVRKLELDETTAFLVVAATLLDLKAARLLPSGQVDDEEDLALLEVRDLLFARLLQYRAFKHVAEMFAELEAAALRSYPRAVSLEDRYEDLLPEVMLGVDAERFAQIAAIAFTPRPVPTVATEHLHELMVSVPEQARQLLSLLEERGIGQWASFSDLVADCRGVHRDRRPLPGSARAVSVPGGSIRSVRTAWCAAGFVDRRTADQRSVAAGRGARSSGIARPIPMIDSSPDDEAPEPDFAVDAPDPNLGIDVATAPELDDDELGAVLEALLLVVDTPVTVEALAAATEQPAYRVAAKLRVMADAFTERDSGIDLREAGGGWRMYTRAQFAPYVERLLLDGSRSKLTRAALETLAVVAYRQPVTRARVSAVRESTSTRSCARCWHAG